MSWTPTRCVIWCLLKTIPKKFVFPRVLRSASELFVTLPALQKFLRVFFHTCLGILHWKFKRAGIFGEFFLVSVSWETKHEKKKKTPRKFGENSEQNSGGNSRQKFEMFGGNFRSAIFLTELFGANSYWNPYSCESNAQLALWFPDILLWKFLFCIMARPHDVFLM